MRIKDEIVCFAHLRWCHNGWASNILIVVDTGYAGIHHSKYWTPIHYDTIEDGQNKNLIFYSLSIIPGLFWTDLQDFLSRSWNNGHYNHKHWLYAHLFSWYWSLNNINFGETWSFFRHKRCFFFFLYIYILKQTICYQNAKNAPTLLLFHGEKLCQNHVLKYSRIQCVPNLHYELQSTMGRYDCLLWTKLTHVLSNGT